MSVDVLGAEEEAGQSILWLEEAGERRTAYWKTAGQAAKPVLALAAWKEGRREEAISELENFLQTEPHTGWAWLELAGWCAAEHADGRFLNFWEKKAEPVRSQLGPVAVLALRKAGLLGKAREVIASDLAAHPEEIEARIQLCELLVAESRFDEAVAACALPGQDEKDLLPVPLAAQAAWAESRRGLRLRALPKMQAVVNRDPSFAWGWELIGSWLAMERRWDEARKAIRRAVELRPGHGRIWADWARVEEADGHPQEATRLLREALAHDPTYGPAYLALVEQSLASADGTEIEALVSEAKPGLPPLFPLAARVLLHLKREQYTEAGEDLTALLRSEGLTLPFLRRIWENAARLGGESLFVRTLVAAIREPGVQPAAAVCWTMDQIECRRLDLADSLMEITEENGARRAAIDCYLKYLTGTPGAKLAANFLKHRNVDSLRQDDWLWGSLAGCLVVVLPYEAWVWGQDWRQHPKAAPWMLRHVSRAALANRKLDEAFAISREALAQNRKDSSFGFHQLVLALEAILQNRTEEAWQMTDALEGVDLPSWERAFSEIVRASGKVQEASASEVKAVWQDRLERLIRSTSLRDAAAPQILAEVVRRLGKPGVSFTAPDPKELRSGWQRPSTWWERFSLSGMGVALTLFGLSIILGLIASQAGAGPRLSVTTVGLMAAAAAVAGGCLAAIGFSWKKSGHWRPGLTFSAIGNGAVLSLALLIYATGGFRPADLPLVALSSPAGKKVSADKTGGATASEDSPEGMLQGREEAASLFDRPKPLALPATLLSTLPSPDEPVPQDAGGLTRAALARTQAKRPQEAAELARQAVALDPENSLAHTVLGMALFQLGDDPEAEKELRLAVEKDDTNNLSWLVLGYWYGLNKNWTESIKATTRAVELQPAQAEPWGQLIAAYRESGQLFAGEMKLKDMTKAHPDTAAVWYQLGALQTKEGMPKAGMASLERALELDPNFAEAWNNLGLASVRLKNRVRAIEAFEKAVELKPDLTEAWNNLAICRLLAGQRQEATDAVEQTLKLDPENKRALVVLISARVLEGKYDQARATCETLAGIDPGLAAKIEAKIPKQAAVPQP